MNTEDRLKINTFNALVDHRNESGYNFNIQKYYFNKKKERNLLSSKY